MFVNILKPNQVGLDTLDVYELTSPFPSNIMTIRQQRKRKRTSDEIPIEEWQKRLALAPIDVVTQTLKITIQYYVSIGDENRMDPRRHLKSRFSCLQLPCLHERVASNTFFLSVISERGNTCTQMFVGERLNRWEVYPMTHN